MPLKKIREFLSASSPTPWLMVVASIVWMFCFKDYLLGISQLQSDAIAYFEHFEFFIRNMAHGEYPMWDSTYEQGLPMEFFLRRIGSFNPFFIIILILFKLSIPFRFAYYTFLVSYFFLGMVGFYLLAKRLFQDSRPAFLAYLLLMFSSLATRLFDSYFLLTIIPMIWFFYFFVRFLDKPSKASLVGMTFPIMIILTTYIPFYFFIILISGMVISAGFYPLLAKEKFLQSAHFLLKNKVSTALCVFLFLCSLVPGYLFYQQTKRGEIIMAERNADKLVAIYQEGDVLEKAGEDLWEVGMETVTSWGIEEDLFYSTHFMNLKRFKFAVVFVPIVAIVIFFMGMFLPVTKRLLFLVSWAVILFLMFSPHGPLYRPMFNHIFFFKYFRNLHFFLWMALLPIFILIVGEQFRILLAHKKESSGFKILAGTALGAAQVIVLGVLIYKGAVNITTVIALVLIASFFVMWLWEKIKFGRGVAELWLLAAIVVQPIQAYASLQQKIPVYVDECTMRLCGTEPYRSLQLDNPEIVELILSANDRIDTLLIHDEIEMTFPQDMYIGSKWFGLLKANLNPVLFNNARSRAVSIYDRVHVIGEDDPGIELFAKALRFNENIAVVHSDNIFNPTNIKAQADVNLQVLNAEMNVLKVNSASVNTLTLTSGFSTSKFMVWANNYNSGWMAYVDGKQVPLYRANVAYMGVWIPSGAHEIHFRYGPIWKHVFNYFLLIMFYVTWGYLLYLIVKENQFLKMCSDE